MHSLTDIALERNKYMKINFAGGDRVYLQAWFCETFKVPV